MSDRFDYGPLDTYEVIWNSGHVEHIQAHQVLAPQLNIFDPGGRDHRWMIHGEVNGHWRLLLMADDADIRSIRNITHTLDSAVGDVRDGGQS